MNTTFKVARLSLNYGWRFVSQKARSDVPGLRRLPAFSGQRRRYADRYTFEDQTQAQIEGRNRLMADVPTPKEAPWRDGEWTADFPERLDELGHESHCNDRLYIAKNKNRHELEQYRMEREERRTEAQQRIRSHFARGSEVPEMTRRRFIIQDPADHQKRQAAIIEQNRRKWLSRPESRRETNTSGITYRPDAQKEKYFEEKAQKELEDIRRTREGAQKKEETVDSQTVVYDPNRPAEAWLKKRQEENEAQYWHTWSTCPGSRESETTEEVKPHLKRKKVVGVPPSYPRDYQRRGFHQIAPPAYRLKAKTTVLIQKRRASGIDKQYHKFARKLATPWEHNLLQTSDNAQPMPRPQVVPKKEEKKKPKKKERRSVEPPKFRMVVKARTPVSRPVTPVYSYSRPSVYMESLRTYSTGSPK
ncbi:uncharacterized protein LOC108113095 [Drosophila eugracilis]|uniref:uncharacterized protein LOC108113095 n=1 Tax=Drosophila eugracilis TaxID=29029 RepID=UPI0007E6BAE1|nr:uncharacterized protein LOC108113095 [Drosophila eugracilis]